MASHTSAIEACAVRQRRRMPSEKFGFSFAMTIPCLTQKAQGKSGQMRCYVQSRSLTKNLQMSPCVGLES